ncbi:hypothetical protein K504DRAFT_492456 [Pleomassaria siparia CBS 279.74]|uniref:Uncharacterized protein n=1 Tax=Pleomassaria siparia CBS 279.74 TaxID=1314801 RepID=A0A6G1K4Z7_9PLEO|nr:hypothetical protein K504DRAFT_492456 [Pleomassaria siparia CBS 279.74]
MPSQTELQSPRPYAIVEAEQSDGELKTRNEPSSEIQRDVATYRDETAFVVYVKLATCLHGHLNGPESEAASLVIFEYEVHSKEDSSVVKSLQTSFKFTQSGNGSPDVKAYAPYVRRRYNPTKAEVTKTKRVEASAGASAGPAELSANFSNEKAVTHEQQYFEKVESWPSYNEREKRNDGVSFKFTQNQSQRSGVTPFFRTAMLLKRSNNMPFMADFAFVLDGGFSYNTTRIFKKVFGVKASDDPINFDPSAKPLYGETQLEMNSLAKYAHGRELDKSLAPIWGVDTHADE